VTSVTLSSTRTSPPGRRGHRGNRCRREQRRARRGCVARSLALPVAWDVAVRSKKRPFTCSETGAGLGALGGTRTPNLLIRSQMLYPLSYERWCRNSLRHAEQSPCSTGFIRSCMPSLAVGTGDVTRPVATSDVKAFRPGGRLGDLQVAFGALESLRRNLACELGPFGIRVLTLQTGGVPESLPEDFAASDHAKHDGDRSQPHPRIGGHLATRRPGWPGDARRARLTYPDPRS
jgi:hypothetical protein